MLDILTLKLESINIEYSLVRLNIVKYGIETSIKILNRFHEFLKAKPGKFLFTSC